MRRAWAIVVVAALAGCQKPPGPQQVWTTAVAPTPTGGRAAAAREIAAQWKAGDGTLDKCIDFAFEQLDAIRTGRPPASGGVVPKSADATAFAGAVLDAVEMLSPKLPMGTEFELFWQRVGGLAFAASEESFYNTRLAEARSLVFAGSTRWQNEPYWVMHTGHDALASAILAQSGDRGLALRRLEERTVLEGQAAEMLAMLKRGQ